MGTIVGHVRFFGGRHHLRDRARTASPTVETRPEFRHCMDDESNEDLDCASPTCTNRPMSRIAALAHHRQCTFLPRCLLHAAPPSCSPRSPSFGRLIGGFRHPLSFRMQRSFGFLSRRCMRLLLCNPTRFDPPSLPRLVPFYEPDVF